MYKNQKGVTMVTLVVTIIVLLILAGISIASVTGDNGILQKATSSKSATEKREEEEMLQIMLNNYAANVLTSDEGLIEFLNNKKTNGEIADVVTIEGESNINVTVEKYTFKVDTEKYEVIEE